MSKGYSFESFAAIIDVNKDSLNEWAHKHKEFSVAKKRAIDKCRYWWEQMGIAGIWESMGQRTGKNNKDPKKLNTAMWIYNMKCRFREEWRDEIVHKGDTAEPLNIVYEAQWSNKKDVS